MKFRNFVLIFLIQVLFHCISHAQGSGTDGALTVAGTTYTDGTRTAMSSTSSSGQTVLNVSSSAGFSNGDLVLIIQMTGTGIGQYEERTISSTGAGTITLTQNLQYSYTVNGSSAAQVIRIPQYTNVTVNGGGTLTANAWNGSTGGVCYFKATGTVAVSGTITVAGLGFSGGAAGSGGAGSASAGTGGAADTRSGCTTFGDLDASDGISGGGAGGSGDCSKGRGTSGACAGCFDYTAGNAGNSGGSANATPGSAGSAGSTGSGPSGGSAGNGGGYTGSSAGWNFPYASGLIMGSGGGGGNGGTGGNGSGPGGGGGAGSLSAGNAGGDGATGATGGAGGAGGAGGGVLVIHCNTLSGAGTISAAGATGSTASNGNTGATGGNGGAGGDGCNGCCSCTQFAAVFVGGGGGGGNGGNGSNGGNGGGGGAGGSMFLVASSKTFSGTETVAAGGAGSGGSAGSAGSGGALGSGQSAAVTCTNCTNNPRNAFGVNGTAGSGGSAGSAGSAATNNAAAGAKLSDVLPIRLKEFSGKSNDGANELWWITATEINNDFFTLERSEDAITFSPLAVIEGAGNSSSDITYTFQDDSPLPYYTYYRLMQTDFDGKSSYSGIVALPTGKMIIDGEVQIFPNPASDYLNLVFNSPSTGNVSISLINANGKVVYNQLFEITKGNHYQRIPINDYADGIYHIMVSVNKSIYRNSFVKTPF